MIYNISDLHIWYMPCTLEEPEQNNRLFGGSVSVKEV